MADVTKEPIAIVGIGCRFPGGAQDAASFWDLLKNERSGIIETPPDRWNNKRYYHPDNRIAGKIQTRWGGFIDDPAGFDAPFFGISPREAHRMDPQQRWVLQVTWEAIEDAGIPPSNLRGTPTGVFVGISNPDYGNLQLQNWDAVDVHSSQGASLGIAANRISYQFDLRGPSLIVDTACSSALVAVDLACRSIWSGECPMVLAGGVNALITPALSLGLSRAAMLSPTGQCYTFDARANGYVRSEGAGMVLMRPLSHALADGDRIYAVIRATAANSDGHTASITVPSQASQEAMLRQALSKAGIAPHHIIYMEAHGTGTPVGDPIETAALGRVLSEGRQKTQPCLIGSVKTNIGHLEPASGVAGLIKTALVLFHQAVPANLNFQTPNPKIPFEDYTLRVATAYQPLPVLNGVTPAAGVNSFGFGGTNAHVILEAAPPRPVKQIPPVPMAQRPYLLPVSARSEDSLRDYVKAYAELLDNGALPLTDLCFNAGTRKEHHSRRLVFIGEDRARLRQLLKAYRRTPEQCPGIVSGRSESALGRPVFVFTGQGAQWGGMGQQQQLREPLFKQTVEAVDNVFHTLSGRSLLLEMARGPENSWMDRTEIAQPAIFALQTALVELWKSWGIYPSAVVGHSVGEVAAAYCAGIYTLEDAVTVIYHRSRLQNSCRKDGRMAAAGITAEEADTYLGEHEGRIVLAGINSPHLVTLSGDAAPMERLMEQLEDSGRYVRWLPIHYAFHSHHMDRIRGQLVEALARIMPQPGTVPFISTVTGGPLPGQSLDARYWYRNVRQTVLFGPAIENLIESGKTAFLEIGPHPALQSAMKECLAERGQSGFLAHSLRREADESHEMFTHLARLHIQGIPVDWKRVTQSNGRFVSLPRYPWHLETYWFELEADRRRRVLPPSHPFLDSPGTDPHPAWSFRLDPRVFDYLMDHRIWESIIFPAAAYGEIGIAISRLLFPDEPHAVESLVMKQALFVSDTDVPTVQTRFDPADNTFSVYSKTGRSGWTFHARGKLVRLASPESEKINLKALQDAMDDVIDRNAYYADFSEAGIQFGPSFSQVKRIWKKKHQSLIEIEVPPVLRKTMGDYHFHPAVLDACLHGAQGAHTRPRGRPVREDLYLPAAFGRIHLFAEAVPARFRAYTRTQVDDGHTLLSDITVLDDDGRPVAEILGFRAEHVDRKNTRRDPLKEDLYQMQWEPAPQTESPIPTVEAETPPERRTVVLFADSGGTARSLAERLEAAGHRAVWVERGSRFSAVSDTHFIVSADLNADLQRVLDQAEAHREPVTDIFHCWSLYRPDAGNLTTDTLNQAQQTGVLHVFRLAQVLGDRLSPIQPRIYVVTRGTERVIPEDRCPGLASGTMAGFVRVAGTEYSDFSWVLLDLEDPRTPKEADLLHQELQHADGERAVAYRKGQRYVQRLHRIQTDDLPARTYNAVEPTGDIIPFRLQMEKPGSLEKLSLNETQRRDPGPEEIEVRVQGAGINFRDVMKVLGMYPGHPIDRTWLGDDFSGTVVRVGENVDRFKPGDPVAGLASYCFRTFVTTDHRMVFVKPDDYTFHEAASLPTVFLTAHYALCHLAHMQAGERVLIHAGAGGVGQAAIQIARDLELEIFATAGSPEKRRFLKDCGVDHVMNSRSLHFADEIGEITGGRGVDAVLNSLHGDFMDKSLSVLAPFGRFLEIGRVDIYADRKIGLQILKSNISYFAIDLAQLFQERPGYGFRLIHEVAEKVAAGRYRPLPIRVFPVDAAEAAFRYMAQGKHVGKIVLSFDVEAVRIRPCVDPGHLFRPDATYLITGGAGGVGLEIARWMAAHGARHLVLMSRSGPRDASAVKAIRAMRREGVTVADARGDVGKIEDIRRVLQSVESQLPPLRGVIHCAVLLDDEFIRHLDLQRFQYALHPKVAGAWNLHTATRDCPLEHFICFSSVSSLIGSARQANYAAANSFLDALAHFRRAEGRCATVINWGPIGEKGLMARNQRMAQYAEKAGLHFLNMREVTDVLERLLPLEAPQVAVSRIDWSTLSRLSAFIGTSPAFSLLRREIRPRNRHNFLRARLPDAPAGERHRMVEDFIAEQIGAVFGSDAFRIDRKTPLTQIGLDSLMAVDLMNRIERQLQMNPPLDRLLAGPNIEELAVFILEMIEKTDEPETANSDALQERIDASNSPAAAPGSAVSEEKVEILPHVTICFRDFRKTDALPAVDAVAVNYFNSWHCELTGLDRQTLIRGIAGGTPVLTNTYRLSWGSIGIVRLPYFEEEVLKRPAALNTALAQALELSAKLSAKTVALTGVLSSITDGGRQIPDWSAGSDEQPVLTTGEAIRAATFVRAAEQILYESDRTMHGECVAWIGLNPFGQAAMELLLAVGPHPETLILCDPYLSEKALFSKAADLRTDGVTSEIRAAHHRGKVPESVYEASLIIGTTSWAKALDVAQLRPGTLLVDYSFPALLNLADAIERFQKRTDILFTSGAYLRLEEGFHETVYLPREIAPVVEDLKPLKMQLLSQSDPREIEGCVLTSLLTDRIAGMPPTLGPLRVADALSHYRALKTLPLLPTRLKMGDFVIQPDAVARFIEVTARVFAGNRKEKWVSGSM